MQTRGRVTLPPEWHAWATIQVLAFSFASSPTDIHNTCAQYLSSIEQSHCTAGRLAKHLNNWKAITQYPWVLHTVQGYKIPFHTNGGLGRQKYETSEQQAKFMGKAIKDLLQNYYYYYYYKTG
jgi:hypothetical protein